MHLCSSTFSPILFVLFCQIFVFSFMTKRSAGLLSHSYLKSVQQLWALLLVQCKAQHARPTTSTMKRSQIDGLRGWNCSARQMASSTTPRTHPLSVPTDPPVVVYPGGSQRCDSVDIIRLHFDWLRTDGFAFFGDHSRGSRTTSVGSSFKVGGNSCAIGASTMFFEGQHQREVRI